MWTTPEVKMTKDCWKTCGFKSSTQEARHRPCTPGGAQNTERVVGSPREHHACPPPPGGGEQEEVENGLCGATSWRQSLMERLLDVDLLCAEIKSDSENG